jgi:hypothetical protein
MYLIKCAIIFKKKNLNNFSIVNTSPQIFLVYIPGWEGPVGNFAPGPKYWRYTADPVIYF